MKSLPSIAALEAALTDAQASHHEYEKTILEGVRDEKWSGYYAAFILGRFGDFAPPSVVSRLLEGAPGTSSWAAGAAAHILESLRTR